MFANLVISCFSFDPLFPPCPSLFPTHKSVRKRPSLPPPSPYAITFGLSASPHRAEPRRLAELLIIDL